MTDHIEQSIDDSLEVEKHLLPYMPYLLQDMWVLGSSEDHIFEALRDLNLPSDQTTVLDLGCGKGGVSVRLAEKFGFKVTGVDVMDVFLDDARTKAEEHHVSHLCQFINQDIHEFVSDDHHFDVVILASLGGILGDLNQTVSKLRNQVRTGGYLLIDDGYLRDKNSLDRKGYDHYRNHQNTINELTMYNDKIIREISTTEFSLKINDEYLSLIRKRGAELIKKHSELKDDITTYIRLQEEECDIIENEIEGALWLIQKSE